MTPPQSYLNYKSKVYSNPTSADKDGFWNSISYISGYTSRASISNGFTEIWSDYFSFYFDDYLKAYWANSSGSLDSYPLTLSLDPYPYTDTTQRPVILSTKELVGTNTLSRIVVNEPVVEPFAPSNQPRPADLIPLLKYKSTENPYINGLNDHFKVCESNDPPQNECEFVTDIRSHVPIASSWNPVEGMTIFASVQTDNEESDYGSIYVYPGFWNGSSLGTLRRRKSIDGQRTNTASGRWDYEGTTEHSVAIACAPSTAYGSGNKNCLIAWNDSGTPRGRIVYSYFSLSCNSSQECTLDQSSAFVRGANSGLSLFTVVGPPSAAWFDGYFWLTWKSPDGRVVVSKKGSTGSWITNEYAVNGNVVETPSFHYVPETNKQAVLFWTEPGGP